MLTRWLERAMGLFIGAACLILGLLTPVALLAKLIVVGVGLLLLAAVVLASFFYRRGYQDGASATPPDE